MQNSPVFLLSTMAVCLALGFGAALPAAAQTPAIGFNSSGLGAEDNAQDAGVSSFSLGFEFTANSAVAVTSLGYFYDPNFDPSTPTFTSPHQVGLYTAGGVLLTQTSVTKSGTQNGFFLYSSIVPIVLVPGTQYVLAGVTGATDPYLFADNDANGNSAITTGAAITYNQDRYTVSGTLAFPGSTDPNSEPGFFGPNFQYAAPAAVPEASSSLALGVLLTLGSLGVVVSRRRLLAAR